MPKPINKTIGKCLCYSRECTEQADIRKEKNEGKLYLNCKEHGIVRLRGQAFQDYILDNGVFDSPAQKTEEPEKNDFMDAVVSVMDEEKKEVKTDDFQTEHKPEKKKGFLSSINDFEL